jgi:actin related protein 2/3 complex subunit 1A/1B
LVWVGHDSSISVAQGNGNGQPISLHSLRTKYLPFLTVVWIRPDSIVAAGHGLTPMMFKVDMNGNGIKLECLGEVQPSGQKKEAGGVSAMKKFQSLDRHARVVNDEDSELNSLHQNAITALQIHSGSKENALRISTSSIDGQIILWDLATLIRQMKQLAI